MRVILQTKKERLIMYLIIAFISFFIGFLFNKPPVVITAIYKYDRVIEFPKGQKHIVTFDLKE
jgi:hypothetical protein